MAAQFATPEAINFMATHGRGLICLALTGERCDELGLDLMAAKNESGFGTNFTIIDRGARGRLDRHLRARPRAHDPGRDRPAHEAARPRPAGPHVPAEGQVRRRARADGPDRGRRGPRAARRTQPVRRDLRGHERRRHDGARARPRAILRAPRPEDDHRRRPDRLPAQARQADRARRPDAPADRLRRLRGRRVPLARGREAPRRDGQGRGRGRGGRARARPLRVPDRRRLPLAALRLRPAARVRAADDRGGGPGRAALPRRRRAAGSGCSTSCAPTSSRRRGSTRSTPTSSSGCPPTCATTASAPRSWWTSGSPRSGCSRTTRRRSSASRATGCASRTRSRSSTSRATTTATTCARSATSSATCSTTRGSRSTSR